jgi:GT2 family glycosyltransferase
MFADAADAPTTATTLSVATHLQQARFVQGGWAVCANLFTSRHVLDFVGSMNPELISSGEVEWCRRVRAAGYDVTYEPTAVVRHPARATIGALCQRAMRHEFAWAQLRETAGLGRGARFWVGQHLVWPLRDINQSLMHSAQLTFVQKVQTSALAVLLMLVRVVAWTMLQLGVKYDVRANWG